MLGHFTRPALFVLVLAACGGDAPSPVAPSLASSHKAPDAAVARTAAAARWNALAYQIVERREGAPLPIARSYALLGVAQYDAIVAADRAPAHGDRPSRAGAAAAAGAAVLAGLYPAEQPVIDAQLAADRAYYADDPAETHRSFAAGEAIGREVAAAALARAAGDGSSAVFAGPIPSGPGIWTSAPPPARPLAPLWGSVRPWLMSSGSEFRPAPPPAFGSPEFLSALAEVRALSDTRTPAQLAIAQFWAFGLGSAGPMGYFSQMAIGLATARGFDDLETARVLAVLNMAEMDASIGCWDAKYTYWYLRPFQADPLITTPVGRPNFPSYPSAHSCFSAAAAGVIAGFFPETADGLAAQVAEAGDARIFAGLHYRFDVTAGQRLGASVAALALRAAPHGRQSIPLD